MVKYGKSGLCWRDCGHQGDLSHILWVCPNLRGYWEDVTKEADLLRESNGEKENIFIKDLTFNSQKKLL